jgi:riboflavin kinase/FMN adenylyltransferase
MSVPRLTRSELEREAPAKPCALTIGVFDGVHLGHQHLFHELKGRADAAGLAAAVITFHPHPLTVLRPNTVPSYLTGLEERIEQIRAAGVDSVAPVTFTAALAHVTAEDFMRAVVEAMRASKLVLGPTFSPIGRGREGTSEHLAKLGVDLGFSVETVSPRVEGGLVVSSTEVRKALAAGDMEQVTRLLGRPYSLSGPVVVGFKRGRTIGFPTANIEIDRDRALPPLGVYATRLRAGEASHASITNIGRRPTFDDGEVSVETHVFDFDGDLYDADVSIDLVHFIRGERKFDGIAALVEQIKLDTAQAREALSGARG